VFRIEVSGVISNLISEDSLSTPGTCNFLVNLGWILIFKSIYRPDGMTDENGEL
jgi:hypothetical protein